VSDQTFESCAWLRVARGAELGVVPANMGRGLLALVFTSFPFEPGPLGGAGMESTMSAPLKSQWRIDPSDPPETRTGWTGCQATEQTSFLWPLSTRNSFRARMSKIRTVWSREPVASRFPFGDQAMAWIVFLC
jgi:hypothetical protein